MPPWDAHALLRLPFTSQQFTDTKFDGAEDKARFGNALCKLVASDFKHGLFTQKLYTRLRMCFGHIAHYNRHGFICEFFQNTAGKIAFLEETMAYPCYGQPEYTYCDVEREIILRLRACGILPFYHALRTAETEHAERAQLARLRHKYEGASPPPTAPRSPPPSALPRPRRTTSVPEQTALF